MLCSLLPAGAVPAAPSPLNLTPCGMGANNMANMNHVILAGNLTSDPEMSYTSRTGTASVKMMIAVNRRRMNQDGTVAFVPLKALGKIA